MKIYELKPITSQKAFMEKLLLKLMITVMKHFIATIHLLLKKWWMVLIKSYGTVGRLQLANI